MNRAKLIICILIYFIIGYAFNLKAQNEDSLESKKINPVDWGMTLAKKDECFEISVLLKSKMIKEFLESMIELGVPNSVRFFDLDKIFQEGYCVNMDLNLSTSLRIYHDIHIDLNTGRHIDIFLIRREYVEKNIYRYNMFFFDPKTKARNLGHILMEKNGDNLNVIDFRFSGIQ